MKQLGLVLHLYRPDVITIASRAIKWCETNGNIQVSVLEHDAELLNRPDLALEEAKFGSQLDTCLSIGGDGTILQAVSLVAKHNVPILGVNAGRLGYLAEVEPESLETVLAMWDADELLLEERMMLDVKIDSPGSQSHPAQIFHALNEVVLYRSDSGRTVQIDVNIADEPFISYVADGVILSTPTGSTAYSLSAGGPIVEPDFEALVLTPVAPHTAFDRSMILAPSTEVTFIVEGHRPGEVTLDGRTIAELQPGGSITCLSSPLKARLLRQKARDFHSVLKDKFGLQG